MEEAKFYVYIQSTTMERPDLERAMEQVLLLRSTIRKAASAFTLEYMYNV
jgi:hypothetical protein